MITNLRKDKFLAVIAGVGLLLATLFGYGQMARAAHTDIHISAASTGTVIQENNTDATVVSTFPSNLNLASSTAATLQANATSSVTAHYGVTVESATTTGDVYWQITVSHATEALAPGDVSITEVGYFDADGHSTATSPYGTPSVVSGDLVFTGNSGWEVSAGEEFTNVDSITFSAGADAGVYTVTRVLIDNATDTAIDGSFAFTVNLVAAADITAPSAPVITFPSSPHSTSTSPIMIGGTAEANSTITVSGGSSTTTATTTSGGNWSAEVGLNTSSTSTLSVTAADAAGNVSAATTLSVTHFLTSTTSPTITITGDNPLTLLSCNASAFVDPGASALDSNGASITASSTGSINVSEPGTYTITYVATDSFGNTSTSTRTVISIACSGGGGGSGSSGGSSRPATPPGLLIAVQNASPNSAVGVVLAGQILVRGQVFVPGQSQGIGKFVRELRRGDRGEDVAILQARLQSTGIYNGPVTGYFGVLTEAAVRTLQRNLEITITGRLDANTMMILNES